jgi:transcription factor IIIB subunit 2
MGGGLVCRACGTVLNESNIVAENQWIENPGGVAGMAGQFVGGNQAAPRTITGMRNRNAYGPGHEGTDSRYQSEQKARATMKSLAPIGIADNLIDQGVQIYKLAVQHGLLHGRTIELVAAVSAYVACRRNPKSNTVMLIDIADQLNINLFVLGALYQKMVDKLKGIGGSFTTTIEPINPESLVNRFADHMEFGSDKIKIVRDAVHIFKRMKRDWITDGRRPAGIAAAAILLAARMNNYHRTVREMVLHAKLTEITINKRLWEFSNTEAAEWHVEQFRKMARQDAEGSQWDGPGPMSLPPAFYMQQVGAPKRPQGRPRKRPRPEATAETAAELEGEAADQDNGEAAGEGGTEDLVEGEPSPKRLRIDADGFKVPSLPMGPR